MADYVIIGGELYHHGVKGMKWGVRKSLKKASKNIKKFTKKTARTVRELASNENVRKGAILAATFLASSAMGGLAYGAIQVAPRVIDWCSSKMFDSTGAAFEGATGGTALQSTTKAVWRKDPKTGDWIRAD